MTQNFDADLFRHPMAVGWRAGCRSRRGVTVFCLISDKVVAGIA